MSSVPAFSRIGVHGPRLLLALIAASWAAAPASLHAYNLFGPVFWGEEVVYPKWGDYHAGQPGGTVTWSIMPDGTTIDPSFPYAADVTGQSSFRALLANLGESEAMAAVGRAFDHWSAVVNIYFEQVDDSGLPVNHADALPPVVGHIRIGAFSIDDPFTGAVGYSAPIGTGPTFSGDILFNADNRFQLAPGEEGDQFEVFLPPDFYFHNDFEGLLAHEIGHTLGIDHSEVNGSLMSVAGPFDVVNRMPDADDIAAAQFLYGPALQADFNRDNAVRGDDLAVWIASGLPTSGATRAMGDADLDGDVDGADLLIVQRELGSGVVVGAAPAATAVPEPGREVTAALAALGAWVTRRNRWGAKRGAGLVA